MGYGFKIGGSSFNQKAVKPTFSGSYTYDTTQKNVIINDGAGYDSSAFTIVGDSKATEYGTYTVRAVLNKGYVWSDGSRTDVVGTWRIAKRVLSVPTLASNNVPYYGVIAKADVRGMDNTYMKQSGTASINEIKSNIAISWELRNTKSTCWSDNTTTKKTVYWNTIAGQIYFYVLASRATIGTTFKGYRKFKFLWTYGTPIPTSTSYFVTGALDSVYGSYNGYSGGCYYPCSQTKLFTDTDSSGTYVRMAGWTEDGTRRWTGSTVRKDNSEDSLLTAGTIPKDGDIYYCHVES